MSTGKATFYSKDPASVTNGKTGSDKLGNYTLDYGTPGNVKEDCGATSKKASFYSRDTSPTTSDTSKLSRKKYMGQERRRKNRRAALDRRADVRFELNKSERRQTLGRRENDATVKFWS